MKRVISSLEEVDKSLHGEYEERDGAFHLKIEGDDPSVSKLRTDHKTFRDNNAKLMKALGATSLDDALEMAGKLSKLNRDRLEEYLEIDLDEVKQLRDKDSKFKKKGLNSEDDIAKLVADAVEKQVGPLKKQVETESQARKTAEDSAKRTRLESSIRNMARKAGALDGADTDIVNRALEVFDLDGVAHDGDEELTDAKGQPLTPESWLKSLATSKDGRHLFKPSGGGGADPKNGGAKPGAKVLVNPSAAELGRYADQIAKGEMVVQNSN